MARKRSSSGSSEQTAAARSGSAEKQPAHTNKKPASKSRGGKIPPARSREDLFPIVGIGASAGGLKALQALFKHMPDEPGVALVIIQHLDPTRESLAPELLGRLTAMQVCQVNDEPRVRPNRVYVIPPGKYLSISGGELHLSEPDRPRGSRMAVDFFLRSLAKDRRHCAVGVILSGTGTDGTLGIKAVKVAGGLVIAQEPGTAEFDGMPRSAIDCGVVDHTLPPEGIPEVLVRYAQHPYLREAHSAEPADDQNEAEATADEASIPDGINAVIGLLRAHTKHDFRCYKDRTLVRRTRRRMCLHHFDDYEEYLQYLRDHRVEVDALAKDLLISVTDFFRDPDAWEELQRLAIRPLVEKQDDDEPIRVWVPGCATGEEPYSAAILILEELKRAGKTCPLNVFASDIDTDAVDFAREGRYPKTIQADVSRQRLQRFFTAVDGEDYFHVSKTLRETVVFAEQNLIADPPFSQLDLVCCRNLLIYLKPDVQEKIIALFHFALRESGTLLLGSAETVGRQTDLFAPHEKRWRIFRRTGPPRHDRVQIPISDVRRRRKPDVPASSPKRLAARVTQLAQQKLLDLLAPAAVVIDGNWRILLISGDVDPYLTHKSGAPTDDLLDKVRHGLRSRLRAAVHTALSENRMVSVLSRMKRGAHFYPVSITVRVIPDPEHEEKLALVVFEEKSRGDHGGQGPEPFSAEEASVLIQRDSETSHNPLLPEAVTGDTDLDDHTVIRQLEEELAHTRDDLQASIEQFETSNEEFKASNEEVMSINEELQSANEELETSKEELQSLNEELSTVNSQLASKVSELETKHADLENLLSVTNVATICVDTDLVVRWFTPAAQQVVRLRLSDKGRPLADLTHDFIDTSLVQSSASVLKNLTPLEDEVACENGRAFLRRVTPYRADDHRIGGVVLTFVDITERKRAEEELRTLNASLEQQVGNRVQALRILQDVAVASNEAGTVAEALHTILKRICEYNHWLLAHCFRIIDDGKATAVPSGDWYVHEVLANDAGKSPALTEFQRSSSGLQFAPGEGMIGRVLETGEPCWIDDVADFGDWRRVDPAHLGIGAAVAFPVSVDGHIVAVLECFSDRPMQREERFLEIMSNVGIQLGHVVERKRLEMQIAAMSEREQRRIGQDIHDGVGQELTGLRYLTQTHADSLEEHSPDAAKLARRIGEGLEIIQRDLRSAVRDLVPVELDEHGFGSALSSLAERVTGNRRVNCVFECERPVSIEDHLTATHLYRIAQEAVSNAVRHAKATTITIRVMEDDDKLELTVIDDGRGLGPEPARRGLGLGSMISRAGMINGRLKLESPKAGGTVVTCTLPKRSL